MAYIIENVPEAIRESKQLLRKLAAEQGADFKVTFDELTESIKQEVSEIKALKDSGEAIIPELEYADLVASGISDAQKDQIRLRGCAIVRNIFPEQQVKDWDNELGDYLGDINYVDASMKSTDDSMSDVQKANPQMFSIYWSKPQVEARQSENLAKVRSHLNRLWHYEQDGKQLFDPDVECTYADRVRRRQAGDDTLGIQLHVDGGSIERWTDEQGFHKVFRKLIAGDWQGYDPFDAAYRNDTREVTSPAVSNVFRTYQGWIALSPQGPGDGTLEVIPMARALAWMYLRAMQDDVAEDDLCGALIGRSLRYKEEWHSLLKDALISIPQMNRGDGIWWHPDVIHGVEEHHNGDDFSSVIYIGAAPACAKNEAYLKKQLPTFEDGRSAPDFSAEDYEAGFEGRGKMEDLTDLGKRQMGAA